MQSLLRSMTPEQRAELESMMEALLRDDRLLIDLAAARLEPRPAAARRARRPRPLQRRRAALARWRARSRSAGSRRWSGWRTRSTDVEGPATSATIDRDEVRDLLGDDAVRDLDALDDLARRLEDAGYLTRDGDRLELTPRGTPQDRPAGPRRPVRAAASATRSAATASTAPGAAASATRRPSRTSSATRSTSTCAGTLGNALLREENAPEPPARRRAAST